MHQIELAIAQFDIDAQLWIEPHEPRHQRHDETLAIGHCASHAQHALGLAGQVPHGSQRFLAPVLQALARLQKGLPSLGQRHLAAGAVEQRCVEMLLKLLDLPADGALGQVQLPGSLGKAAAVRHVNERLKGLKRGHTKDFIHAFRE